MKGSPDSLLVLLHEDDLSKDGEKNLKLWLVICTVCARPSPLNPLLAWIRKIKKKDNWWIMNGVQSEGHFQLCRNSIFQNKPWPNQISPNKQKNQIMSSPLKPKQAWPNYTKPDMLMTYSKNKLNLTNLNSTNQTKQSNPSKPNQTKPSFIKPNQAWPNYTKPNMNSTSLKAKGSLPYLFWNFR